ncbi:MAG TPA: HEAT repeat domain-containing protein [Thermomicrobiales bacterium]|nr:HEAT repeat domain-containing protein [Thermomicrobiales bacterium]
MSHIEHWMRLYSSANPVVRERALAALANAPDPRVTPVLLDAFEHYQEYPGVDTVRAMQQSRDPALLEPMLRFSTHPDAQIRAGACEVLGALADRRATPALVERLGDEDIWVRRAAGFALAAVRDPAALEPLRQRYDGYPADDINVRVALHTALRALSAPPPAGTVRRPASADRQSSGCAG